MAAIAGARVFSCAAACDSSASALAFSVLVFVLIVVSALVCVSAVTLHIERSPCALATAFASCAARNP